MWSVILSARILGRAAFLADAARGIYAVDTARGVYAPIAARTK